ncbi:MAG: hypothetical protein M1825_004574 [Sarcosagium campestre]|nr:MAG: hypothetical protein M1825_004574 [Sarcosagium campestre]
MPTALVTGANSGIGLALAELLLTKGYTVIATDADIGPEIQALKTETVQMDISAPDSIAAFVKHVGDRPLDLLLNVAGIMADKETDTLLTTTLTNLVGTCATNAFGPFILTQALLPNLLRSSRQPRIGNVSSRVGSITDNATGGMYAYRASKAALNSISKCMAVDLKDRGVVVVVLHPGIVRTALDPSSHDAELALDPDQAAVKLYDLLMSKDLEQTGRFWHREGLEIPW